MLTSALVFAVASAFALFILLVKLNIRRILGYDVFVDITCTIILLTAMEGTATGMGAAMVAAVVISLFLYVIKLCVGFERLELVSTPFGRRLQWISYRPVWIERVRSAFHVSDIHKPGGKHWERDV